MFDGPNSIFRKINLFGQSQSAMEDKYRDIGMHAENAGYMVSGETYQHLKNQALEKFTNPHRIYVEG